MAQLERTMFREYDIRGRESSEELNEDSVGLIARAYAAFLVKRGIQDVVVGYDNRRTSESFTRAAIDALVSSGCRVTAIGIATTPLFYWSQHYLKIQGGLMVTASHNPVGWNGLKLAVGYSRTLNQAELQELYGILLRNEFVENKGTLQVRDDIFPAYKKDLLSRIPRIHSLKIVVNTGNGTAGFFVPEVLRDAGCEVVEYLTEPDPSYPKYTPNPAQVEMMEDTGKKVLEVGADLGFAFDGDADRLGLSDEKGQNIWPDRYLILLSRLLLQKKPGAKIVFDVKVSQALPEDIAEHGGVPIMWKTGHSYIKEKMQEEGAALGGEMSGHIFFQEGYYGFDDALFCSLKLLEYFSQEKKKVSELISGTPYYISSPALHVSCPDEKKYQVAEDLTRQFKEEGYNVIDINGARVQFGDGWGLVRATSNLPALVVRFEAKTEQRLAEIEGIFKKKLLAYEYVGKEWESA